MRVAILNEAFDTTGGVEYYLRALSSALAGEGHEVLVLAQRASDVPEGVSVALIPGLGPFDADRDSAAAAAALGHLQKFAPDAVYHHQVNSPHLLREISARWRTVRYIHNHGDACPSGSRLLRHRRCTRVGGFPCIAVNAVEHCGTWRPAAFVDAVRRVRDMGAASGMVGRFLVASGHVQEEMARQGFPAARIEVLPYFVEGPASPPPYSEALRGRVLFAGRATREKGLVELVSMMAGLGADWTLEIRASGYTLEPALAEARRRGVAERVLAPGWAGQAELRRSFAEAAVVVLPSRWPEPFGIVGVQAGLWGRPVVAYSGGGVGDWLIDGANGVAVAPGDPEAFSAALEGLLADPEDAERMGARGVELARRFDRERHVRRLLQILAGRD